MKKLGKTELNYLINKTHGEITTLLQHEAKVQDALDKKAILEFANAHKHLVRVDVCENGRFTVVLPPMLQTRYISLIGTFNNNREYFSDSIINNHFNLFINKNQKTRATEMVAKLKKVAEHLMFCGSSDALDAMNDFIDEMRAMPATKVMPKQPRKPRAAKKTKAAKA